MKYKLINVSWIDKEIKECEELLDKLDVNDENGYFSIMGCLNILTDIEKQLISPTEEIKKAFETGAHAFNNAMDSLDYDKEFNSELEKYLKKYESDNI